MGEERPTRRATHVAVLVAGLAASVAAASCKRDPALLRPDAEATDDLAPLAPVTLPEAGPPIAAPRCTAEGARVRIAEGTNGDVEVGDGVATPGGYALGLVRATAKGRVASVALVPTDLASVTLVDLGPAVGEAPPPRVVAMGDALYAGYHGLRTTRTFELFRIDRAHTPVTATRAYAVAQPKDESFATDVALAGAGAAPVVVWDEAVLDGTVARGLVRVATLSPLAADGGAAAGSAVTLSAKTTDADGPRIARRNGGFWVVWTAHRAERDGRDAREPRDGGKAPAPRAPAYEAEGPAEEREYRWLEAVALDDAGHAVGTVRSLTAHAGHVEAFDLAPLRDGSSVDVLVTDATEARDGEGGHVTRITLRDAASPPEAAVVLADRGVGRAAAELLAPSSPVAGAGTPSPSALPWLAFADPAEHTRLVVLGAGRAAEPPGFPSVEPALEGGRPMFAVARGDAGGASSARVTLVSLFDDKTGAELRTVTCAR